MNHIFCTDNCLCETEHDEACSQAGTIGMRSVTHQLRLAGDEAIYDISIGETDDFQEATDGEDRSPESQANTQEEAVAWIDRLIEHAEDLAKDLRSFRRKVKKAAKFTCNYEPEEDEEPEDEE